MNESKRITQLDSVRFFMCLMIVFGHCTFLDGTSLGWIRHKISNATLPLDYFFILSGFGIYYAANKLNSLIKFNTLYSCILYAIKKIKKIYPVYVIILLIYAPLYLLSGSLIQYSVLLLLDLTMMQSLAPTVLLSHAICGPFWFLSVLFISYIFCPLFYYLVKKCTNRGLYVLAIITMAIILLTHWLSIKYANQPYMLLGKEFLFDIGSTPYTNIWKPLLGMILGRWYCENKSKISARIGGGGSNMPIYAYVSLVSQYYYQALGFFNMDTVY